MNALLMRQRRWITPAVIGAFLLLAVTGSLMFFHLDSGLNKVAHEWVGWIMVGAVVLHVLMNQLPFERHLKNRVGLVVVLAFALVLGLSFVPAARSNNKRPQPSLAAVHALAAAPLPVLAQVAGVSPEAMRSRLASQGLQADGTQSLQQLVGNDVRKQMRAVDSALQPAR